MKRFMTSLIVITIGIGIYVIQKPQPELNIAEVNFTLLDGRRIKLNQLQGRPVLVTFWATSCRSCIQEIPDLIHLYNKYSKTGLEIIAVAMPYDRPDHVLAMTKQRKLPYPVALDIDAKVVRAFGNIRITPNNFIIAPDGKIIKHQIGILDVSEAERLLQSM